MRLKKVENDCISEHNCRPGSVVVLRSNHYARQFILGKYTWEDNRDVSALDITKRTSILVLGKLPRAHFRYEYDVLCLTEFGDVVPLTLSYDQQDCE